MKREEILQRLGIKMNPDTKIRVIICSDVKNEADDPYAIMHQLLTPKFDICGIVAGHFESKAPNTKTTMLKSYNELEKLIEASQMDDIKIFKGCDEPLQCKDVANSSEGVDFIIEEAMKIDERPLYITCLGALTDVASAIIKCPEIANKITIAWTGGEVYPNGGKEFNLKQDVKAAQIVFDSSANIYQLTTEIYNSMNTTLSELKYKVYPCGSAGKYLYEEIESYSYVDSVVHRELRSGENWSLADLCIGWTLIDAQINDRYDLIKAPKINDDMTYSEGDQDKLIRVYHKTDTRAIFEDLFAKLALCYKTNI